MAAVHQHFKGLADELFVSGELNLALAFFKTARRRLFSSSGMASGMCRAEVFGRGEYLNEKMASYRAASSSERVSAKSSSVSPGKPTMMSEVMLMGRRAARIQADFLQIFFARVSAEHCAQHAGGTGLHRQSGRGRRVPERRQSRRRSRDENHWDAKW